MSCRRWRAFTLIEVLISLALTSILLTFLLSTYSQVILMKKKVSELRKEAMTERVVQHRLAQIFYRSLVKVGDENKKKSKPIFYTKEADSLFVRGKSLVFSYDNGVVLDPFFSHSQLGRLYLDQEDRLCLASWPLPLEQWEGQLPPMQHEVLMEGVKSLSFSFFYPWEALDEVLDVERESIMQSWPLEIEAFPVLLELSISISFRREEEKTISWTFPLPHPNIHPVFVER